MTNNIVYVKEVRERSNNRRSIKNVERATSGAAASGSFSWRHSIGYNGAIYASYSIILYFSLYLDHRDDFVRSLNVKRERCSMIHIVYIFCVKFFLKKEEKKKKFVHSK